MFLFIYLNKFLIRSLFLIFISLSLFYQSKYKSCDRFQKKKKKKTRTGLKGNSIKFSLLFAISIQTKLVEVF